MCTSRGPPRRLHTGLATTHILSDIFHNVSESPPGLLPIFRSTSQAALLAELFLDPDAEHSLVELTARTGVSQPTVQREVSRLELAGLLVSRRQGPARYVRANRASPYFGEMESLLRKAFGPVRVLAEELEDLEGVETAYVYGSWARRYDGEAGPAPADIDVLVVGEAEPDDVYAAAHRAERRLGRPVNVTLLTPAEWERPRSGFLTAVKTGPLVPVPTR